MVRVWVRVWQSRQDVVGRFGLVFPALLVLAACGCKSSSWSSRPAWMGGAPSGSSLTSAPSFDGGIAKPSETAKPYPTTNTPDGYVLTDATKAGATKPSASPSAVTYGSTPPAAMPAAAATPTKPAAIAAQVGPYAPLQQTPSDPAGAVTAGLAAAPAFGASPTSPTPTPPPASDRFADARGGGWGATPPGQPPAATQATAPMAAPPSAPPADSRYGAVTTSRFSAGTPAMPPAEPMPQPQWSPTPPPTAPAAVPPPATPAPSADSSLPGAIPPPTRRPDPGYRPGGTSSYRPTRSLLPGEDGMNPVQPVSFEAPPQ